MLDLFAGTGALGFEALSRGAAHASFVERDGVAARMLREHVRMLGARADVAHMDARAFLRQRRLAAAASTPDGSRWDLIFLDPPFNTPLLDAALANLEPVRAPNAVIYVETNAELSFQGYETYKSSHAGNVHYGLLTPTSTEGRSDGKTGWREGIPLPQCAAKRTDRQTPKKSAWRRWQPVGLGRVSGEVRQGERTAWVGARSVAARRRFLWR